MKKTIVALEDRSHKITYDTQDRMLLDGKVVGYRPAWHHLSRSSLRDPFTFSALVFKTSDGKLHCVADRFVECTHPNNQHRLVNLCPTVLRCEGKWLNYQQAKERLQLGGEFRLTARPSGEPKASRQPKAKVVKPAPEPERPFSRDEDNRVLTNGKVVIPFDRPSGFEWYDRRWRKIGFLKKVHWASWDLMLQIVEGKFLRDIIYPTSLIAAIADLKQLRKQQEMDEKRRQREQVLADKKLKAFLAGQCFDTDDAKAFYLGGKFLFTLEKDGRIVHVVDAPRYGVGFYAFKDETQARAWASGMIDFRTARGFATAFIVHDKDKKWRQRANEALGADFLKPMTSSAAD